MSLTVGQIMWNDLMGSAVPVAGMPGMRLRVNSPKSHFSSNEPILENYKTSSVEDIIVIRFKVKLPDKSMDDQRGVSESDEVICEHANDRIFPSLCIIVDLLLE